MTRSSGSRGPRYTLNQFKHQEELGAGAFGTVKRVVNKDTGEVFAMKVLEKDRVRQRSLEEQLKREVLTQVRVKHPNVVRLHYYFEDAHRIYCLLEFAERGTLFSLIKTVGRGLPEDKAARLFGESASGLHYLHGLHVVHRDLKPENILLFGAGPTAKLGDFGWCVELTPKEPERRTFCGTMDYLAPEMLNSEPHDYSVDLWAMGVLLYEILLGRAPFAASSHKEAMEKICSVRYQIPPASIPEPAENIIRGLLVHAKEKRTPLAQVLQSEWILAYHSPGASPVLSHGSPVLSNDGSSSLEATQVVPRSKEASPSPGAALDDRTYYVPRGPGGASPSPPIGSPGRAGATEEPGGTSGEIVNNLGREGTGGTFGGSSASGRVPSGSPSRAHAAGSPAAKSPDASKGSPCFSESSAISPVHLPDLLSTVRNSGIALKDLDERLLGAPRSSPGRSTPGLASPDASPVVSGSSAAGTQADLEKSLVKALVVSSVPRPKALSRRSARAT